MGKYKPLDDDEIGCVTCARYGTRVYCDNCIRWSQWKGLKQVNKDLIEHGFTPYKNIFEMRYDMKYGFAELIRYRRTGKTKIQREIEKMKKAEQALNGREIE